MAIKCRYAPCQNPAKEGSLYCSTSCRHKYNYHKDLEKSRAKKKERYWKKDRPQHLKWYYERGGKEKNKEWRNSPSGKKSTKKARQKHRSKPETKQKIREYGKRPYIAEYRRNWQRNSQRRKEWLKKWHEGRWEKDYLTSKKTILKKRFGGLSLSKYFEKTKKCEICGFPYNIELHHIIPNVNTESNLIGLCPNHHEMVEKGIGILEQKDNKVTFKENPGRIKQLQKVRERIAKEKIE